MALVLNGSGSITGVTDLATAGVALEDAALTDPVVTGGIYLGGTGAANYLDDYEEGTWTPGFAFGGASVGITYGHQKGRYTKIGNRCIATCYVLITNKGSSSGNLSITGLPFAAESGTNYYNTAAIWGNSLTGISGQLQCYVSPGSSSVNSIGYLGTGGLSDVTNSNCFNNTDFMISVSYPV